MKISRPTKRTLENASRKGVEQQDKSHDVLKIEIVPINSISPNDYNPNQQDQKSFELLCRSIKTEGFTQPILVDEQSMIIDGEHRWHAAKAIGLTEIPIVRKQYTESGKRISTLRHNRARGQENAGATKEVLADIARFGDLDIATEGLLLNEDELIEVEDLIAIPTTLPDLPIYEKHELPKGARAGKRIIPYYGGKEKIAEIILALIPEHKKYVEPFFGSGAVFFAKPPSREEYITDLQDWLIDFYQQYKSNYDALMARIHEYPSSRSVFEKAREILRNTQEHSKLDIAWATWYGITHGYGSNPQSFNGTDTAGRRKGYQRNAVHMMGRLDNVIIESRDALQTILLTDRSDSFFYIDPPYIGTNMGFYKGYTTENYQELLSVLASVQGKFILSGYDNQYLAMAIEQNGWYALGIKSEKTITTRPGVTAGESIEILASNFPLDVPK